MPLPIRNEEAEERPVLFILRDMTAPTHVQISQCLNRSVSSWDLGRSPTSSQLPAREGTLYFVSPLHFLIPVAISFSHFARK